MKILVCGDIEGHFKEVSERVDKLNKSKLGPFDMLFCVGKVLPDEKDYQLSDSIPFNIPTYVILNDKSALTTLLGLQAQLPNVTFISNVELKSINGLNIAFVPGYYSEADYLSEDINASGSYKKREIDELLKCKESSGFRGIDMVFSAEWAYGMTQHVDASHYPAIPLFQTVGSPILSEVLYWLCPRYHFAASQNAFYERVPYVNRCGHGTRCIYLGPVRAGSDKSRKWLHALNLKSLENMTDEELQMADSSATPCPFDRFVVKRSIPAGLGREERAPKAALTGEMVAKLERESGAPANYRFAASCGQSSCWFCLASANVEKHLLISIGENSYLACPKGGFGPSHVLIIPTIHRQSSVQLPEAATQEIEQFKQALGRMFIEQGKGVLLWERNLTTRNPTHCNIQVLPIDKDKLPVVKIVLDAAATQRGFHFSEIPEATSLKEYVGEDDYLYAETWGPQSEKPKRYAYVVKERRPNMQFFHQAVGSLIEMENAGSDWKSMQKSVEEETRITDEFRELFKPYDFTIMQEQ